MLDTEHTEHTEKSPNPPQGLLLQGIASSVCSVSKAFDFRLCFP